VVWAKLVVLKSADAAVDVAGTDVAVEADVRRPIESQLMPGAARRFAAPRVRGSGRKMDG
jgi:hypothetical protein